MLVAPRGAGGDAAGVGGDGAISAEPFGLESEEEEPARVGFFRRGIGGVWILLVLFGLLGRMCSGG